MLYKNASRLSAIRDSDGNLIQSTIDSEISKSETYTYGMRLDLTDDYIDPRRGIRAETSLWHTPPSDDDAPDSVFYSTPRRVMHIDNVCAEQITAFYRNHLRAGDTVLDLMA